MLEVMNKVLERREWWGESDPIKLFVSMKLSNKKKVEKRKKIHNCYFSA